MTKIERFEAVDRCLFWKEKKILIVGDLHLGYEEWLNERGWSFPKTQMEESIRVFERIFEKTGKLKKVILLGDVKHYVSGVLSGEFKDVYKILDLISKNLYSDGEIIITKGNHDGILEEILKKYDNIKLVEYYELEDVLFFHGNKNGFSKIEIFDKKHKIFVIGHLHPALTLSEDAKSEKYKSFVFGKYRGKKMIVIPSFFPLIEGTDVTNGEVDFSNFKAFAVDDNGDVYDFGKVGRLK